MDKNINTQAAHACVSSSTVATAPERTMPEKFLYIMDLAMRLNSTPTARDKTGDRPTVFVEFGGHIADVQVTAYPRGFESHADQVIVCHYGMDGSYKSDWHPHKAPVTINEMIAYLETQVAKWCNA